MLTTDGSTRSTASASDPAAEASGAGLGGRGLRHGHGRALPSWPVADSSSPPLQPASESRGERERRPSHGSLGNVTTPIAAAARRSTSPPATNAYVTSCLRSTLLTSEPIFSYASRRSPDALRLVEAAAGRRGDLPQRRRVGRHRDDPRPAEAVELDDALGRAERDRVDRNLEGLRPRGALERQQHALRSASRRRAAGSPPDAAPSPSPPPCPPPSRPARLSVARDLDAARDPVADRRPALRIEIVDRVDRELPVLGRRRGDLGGLRERDDADLEALRQALS